MASKMTQDDISRSMNGLSMSDAYTKSQEQLTKVRTAIDKEAIAALKEYNKELSRAKLTETEIARLMAAKKKELDAQAAAAKAQAEANIHAYQLTHSTLEELKQMSQARIEALKLQQEELALDKALADTSYQKRKTREDEKKIIAELADEEGRLARFSKAISNANSEDATYAQKKAAAAERLAKAQKEIKTASKEKNRKLRAANSQEEREAVLADYSGTIGKIAEDLDLGSIGTKIVSAFSGPLGTALNIFQGISDATNAIQEKLDGSVDEAMNTISKYMGPIDARLQSLDSSALTFSDIQDDINHKIGISPYVSQKDLFAQVSNLVNAGISYNVEQRALIQELKDRMVTTFDVLDASLTRLIRLEQADLTMTQLGSEAQLTKFLNATFQDTSYLNSLYDTITGALIDATSQLDVDQATSYNYAVQKWLGSLYSVGMSESTVSTIASGITALSTGDASTINNNASLRTLLGMAANYAGTSIDSLLTNGMTSSDVNELMKAIVEYLQDIADNTSNNVEKSAYASILGVSVADLVAAQNLTDTDITSIYNSSTNYESALKETSTQLSAVKERTTLATKIDTLIDNTLFDFGMQVAESDLMYGLWKANIVANELSSMFPGSEVAGEATSSTGILGIVNKALTAATFGVELVALVETVMDAVTSLSNASGLGGFEWSAYTSRGEGFGTSAEEIAELASATYGGTTTGISYSGAITSTASSADSNFVTLADNANQSSYYGATTDAASTVSKDVGDIYAELFENQTKPIKVKLTAVDSSITEALLLSDIYKKINSLDQTVSNKVNVDIITDDINSLISNVYRVRGSIY